MTQRAHIAKCDDPENPVHVCEKRGSTVYREELFCFCTPIKTWVISSIKLETDTRKSFCFMSNQWEGDDSLQCWCPNRIYMVPNLIAAWKINWGYQNS